MMGSAVDADNFSEHYWRATIVLSICENIVGNLDLMLVDVDDQDWYLI